MNKSLTTSEIYGRKNGRMLLILRELEKHPMKERDIATFIMKCPPCLKTDRSIQYYLKELVTLRIIERDDEDWYHLPIRREFSSAGYETAVEHSKRLLLSYDAEHQGFDRTNPDKWLEILLNHERHANSDEIECLLQHLRTGYYNEFWLTFEEFKNLKTNAGQSAEQSEIANNRKRDLIRAMSKIISRVKNGTLLKGTCEYCPSDIISNGETS